MGAYLLGLWALPFELVEAVAYHHEPGPATVAGFTGVSALHAAVALQEHPVGPTVPGLNSAYLKEARLEDHVESWRDVAAQLGGAVSAT